MSKVRSTTYAHGVDPDMRTTRVTRGANTTYSSTVHISHVLSCNVSFARLPRGKECMQSLLCQALENLQNRPLATKQSES